MIKKVLGVLVISIGASILVWIGYNYLIEMQPEFKGRNPIGPLLFSCAAIFVGSKWIFGKKEK